MLINILIRLMRIVWILMLLVSVIYTNGFAQFKQEMQSRIDKISQKVLEQFQRFDSSCFQKSTNECLGTSNLKCYQDFQTKQGCLGEGSRLSEKSSIRIQQIQSDSNLSPEQKYLICLTARLQNDISQRDERYLFTYIGTSTGMIRLFPSITQSNQTQCMSYDPRYRTWYVSSALAGKKNILFLIDSRNPMKEELPTMKISAQKFVQTLPTGDNLFLFQIAEQAKNLFNEKSFLEVQQDKSQILNIINNLSIDGSASYHSALKKGLDAIQSQAADGKLCCKVDGTQMKDVVIMFFTDGTKINQNDSLPSIISLIDSYTTLRIQMFIISLTTKDIQQNTDYLKSLACQYNGALFSIKPDYSQLEIRQTMQKINTFMAKNQNFEKPVWSEFYEDAFGYGRINTITKPIYFFNDTVGYLIGVAGIDVHSKQWLKYQNQIDQVQRLLGNKNQYTIKSEECEDYQHLRQYKCDCSNITTNPINFPTISGTVLDNSPESVQTSTCCLSSVGAFIGILIGCILLLTAILISSIIYYRYRQKKTKDDDQFQAKEKYKNGCESEQHVQVKKEESPSPQRFPVPPHLFKQLSNQGLSPKRQNNL